MIYDIILNMEKAGIKPRIKVSQYDKTLPQIRATLYSNNQAFNIPSGSTVYISGTKKDNTGFKYECTYSDNVITADITEQMTAFSGDVEIEFTIESSGSRKGTENFILEVEKAALEDDVVISETDIPAIQRLSQPASTTQLGVVKVDGTSVTIDADGTLHSSGGGGGAVQSVNGKTGAVVLDADDIDDTNTTNKFTNSTEKQAWNGKSTVSVTQIKSSGEKIATINVNGTDTDLYASAGGGGGGGAVDSVNGMTGDVVLDLDDIHDTVISSPTDGQVLGYDSTTSKWTNINQSGGVSSVNGETGAVVLDADDISDTNTTNKFVTATEKSTWDGKQDALTFTSTPSASNKVVTSDDLPTVPSDIDDLSDVEITSPSNGQVLGYDGSKWTNVNAPSGGGGHTIKNESGTALTQRDNLQFKGCAVSDDSTNNATIVSVQTSNRNLLDNAWFTVNQKGFTSGTRQGIGETTPFIDRWRGVFSQVVQSDTAITYNSDNSLKLTFSVISGQSSGIIGIVQNLEQSLIGKAITLSFRFADDTIVSNSFVLAAGTTAIGSYDGVSINLYATSGNEFRFQFTSTTNGKTITLKAIKIEIGSQSTLAFDTAPDYTTELLKCQRYLQKVTNSSIICMRSMRNDKLWWGEIELPVPMRATPTFTYTSATIDAYATSSTYIESESCSVSVTYRAQSVDVSATSSSSGMAGSCGAVYINSGWLDAQL